MAAMRWTVVCAGFLVAGLPGAAIRTHERPAESAPTQKTAPAHPSPVPTDLRPLLAKPQSEMRLVTQRYTIDRQTLNGNYDGGRGVGRGGRGQGASGSRAGATASGGATPGVPTLSLSPNRIARLKRFDISWQAALAELDASRLSAAARADLDSLKTTIRGNLAQLEAETAAIAEIMPIVPFAPTIVRLSEARIRMEDVRPQQSAGTLTDLAKQIAEVRARLEAGLAESSNEQ